MSVLTVRTNPSGAVLLCDPWKWNDYNHFFGVTPYAGDYGSSDITYNYMVKKPGYKSVYFSWNMQSDQTFDFTLEPDGTTPPPVSDKCTPPETQLPRYPGFHTYYVIENRLPSYAWMVVFGTAPWLCQSCPEQDPNDPECLKWECCPYYQYQPPPGYIINKIARHGIVFGYLPWCQGQYCGWTLSYVELSGPVFPLEPPCEYGGGGGGGGPPPDPCNCSGCLDVNIERTCSPRRIQSHSPIIGGISVGRNDWAGTLGCFVKDNTDNNMVMLSNEHVIGWPFNNAAVGDDIHQPAQKEYNSNGGIHVADLKRWGGIRTDYENTVDAAVASIVPGTYFSNHFMGEGFSVGDIPDILRVNGIATAHNGMACRKVGRTTGLTEGSVISTDFSGSVGYSGDSGAVTAPFVDQLLVGICACPGDSGSIVTDMSGNIIGILFAGGTDAVGNPIAVVNKIQNVLSNLNITVVPSPSSTCIEGSTRCSGSDLELCHLGGWVIEEHNSSECQLPEPQLKIDVSGLQARIESYSGSVANVMFDVYISCAHDSIPASSFNIDLHVFKNGNSIPTHILFPIEEHINPGDFITKTVSAYLSEGIYNFCAEVY